MSDWTGKLVERFGPRARPAEPLRLHTTFRIGGAAEMFLTVHSLDELLSTVGLCRDAGVRLLVLGKGSNVLAPDEGLSGLVVTLDGELAAMRVEAATARLVAGGGGGMDATARCAATAGLAGLAWSAGLPGTVGGAIAGNAGAWGGCVKDVLAEAVVVDRAARAHTVAASDLELDYRSSAVTKNGWIIVEATFALARGNREELERTMADYRRKRALGQPGGASAGSIFRNPPGNAAGRLLDEAGCKGLRVGAAVVSSRHANFVINEGAGTAADVKALIEMMRRRVAEHAGVELELEVKLL